MSYDSPPRLERDKAEALSQQKEAMNRAFRVQLSKLLKEKEDLVRKCQQQSCGGKAPAAVTAPASSSVNNGGDSQKLSHEIAILRGEKKKLEEQLQVRKKLFLSWNQVWWTRITYPVEFLSFR